MALMLVQEEMLQSADKGDGELGAYTTLCLTRMTGHTMISSWKVAGSRERELAGHRVPSFRRDRSRRGQGEGERDPGRDHERPPCARASPQV
jgi:hypothetical protein